MEGRGLTLRWSACHLSLKDSNSRGQLIVSLPGGNGVDKVLLNITRWNNDMVLFAIRIKEMMFKIHLSGNGNGFHSSWNSLLDDDIRSDPVILDRTAARGEVPGRRQAESRSVKEWKDGLNGPLSKCLSADNRRTMVILKGSGDDFRRRGSFRINEDCDGNAREILTAVRAEGPFLTASFHRDNHLVVGNE